jgi:hypothetical protein
MRGEEEEKLENPAENRLEYAKRTVFVQSLD